eukprot:TCONS_00062016-protein
MILLQLTLLAILANCTSAQDCTCDLISNQCDLNCCCDPDCNENDKLAFSSCIPENVNRIEEVCVSDNILYSSNNKYQAQGNGMGMFCIYKDNYEARHLYSNVPFVSTKASFDALADQFESSSYHSMTNNEDQTTVSTEKENLQNTFKAGDPMYILFDNNQQGYLPLPTTFLTNECEDQNQAKFLFQNKTTCKRSVGNLQTECGTKKSLNAQTYINGFKVAPYPSFINGEVQFTMVTNENNATIQRVQTSRVQSNDTNLIQPTLTTPLKCIENGLQTDCPFNDAQAPTWNGTHCENVLHEVEYNIKYTINSTVTISEVSVAFVLGSISPPDSLMQKFSYKFEKSGVSTSNDTTTERSGNPGYLTGLPIKTGTGYTDSLTETEKINITESADVLTLMTSPSNSLCGNPMEREEVKFGINYQATCFIQMEKTVMTTQDCVNLQNEIDNVLLPTNLPNRVTSFGNTITQNVDQWVTVINARPNAAPTESNGYCTNMMTDVSFRILYSKTGFYANPQNQIVGFEINYGSLKDLQYQCPGLFCDDVNRALISQSVSFIDVSTTPVSEVKPKPKFRSKAPNDFFYPFL